MARGGRSGRFPTISAVTTRVLFVCTGNVCRSPFAELLGRTLFPSTSLELASVGLGALVGHPVDRHMAHELELRRVPSGGFVARMLDPQLIAHADIVLTMDDRQREAVIRESPESVWKVYVIGQFARIVQSLPPGLEGEDLAKALRAAHKPPEPGDEVADPRNKGPAAAAASAEALEALLRTSLPYLVRPDAT